MKDLSASHPSFFMSFWSAMPSTSDEKTSGNTMNWIGRRKMFFIGAASAEKSGATAPRRTPRHVPSTIQNVSDVRMERTSDFLAGASMVS